MDEQLRIAALEYHRLPTPGKLSVTPTKGLINQRDLALAYSPGVAAACDAIAADPAEAGTLTSRANLVAVVTNGTAVLGLGNIGPLAGKPVMEGKACLFKKFAGIDVFDIEIAETDPEELVKTIAAAGADLRRHQSRGHQGAGLLLRRAEAARADEDPRLSRRPARHGDRRRRVHAQRPQGRGQGHRQGQARVLGRGRGGDRLPRPDGRRRAEARERRRLRQPGRDLHRPRDSDGGEQGALRLRTPRRARWRTPSPAPTSSSACPDRRC